MIVRYPHLLIGREKLYKQSRKSELLSLPPLLLVLAVIASHQCLLCCMLFVIQYHCICLETLQNCGCFLVFTPNSIHTVAVQHGDPVKRCVGFVGLGGTPSGVLSSFTDPSITRPQCIPTLIVVALDIIFPSIIAKTITISTTHMMSIGSIIKTMSIHLSSVVALSIITPQPIIVCWLSIAP